MREIVRDRRNDATVVPGIDAPARELRAGRDGWIADCAWPRVGLAIPRFAAPLAAERRAKRPLIAHPAMAAVAMLPMVIILRWVLAIPRCWSLGLWPGAAALGASALLAVAGHLHAAETRDAIFAGAPDQFRVALLFAR